MCLFKHNFILEGNKALCKDCGKTKCFHEWNIIQDVSIHNAAGTFRIANRYDLQCKHCGDVKSERFSNG